MKTLVHVLTVPESLRFLRGQPAYMREHGFETHVVCSPGPLLDRFAQEDGATPHALAMDRAITPGKDLATATRLTRLLRRLRTDVVHAQTPKGGLLGVLAGRAAGVPRILYHMRGLPFMGATGARRGLLVATERVACTLAHAVICQSPSIREVALDHRLVSRERSRVLGPGGNGVDAGGRFDPDGAAAAGAAELRGALSIPPLARVIGFVGRIVRDKGIAELADAWARVRESHLDAHLLLVGPVEPADPVPEHVLRAFAADPRVHILGETEDVARAYALMDVLALPSYREGFPNVPMEAAAMRVPVVASRIAGCVDAVADGETGTLVPVRESHALARALARYLDDPELRARHGAAGRARVLSEHTPARIHAALVDVYAGRGARASDGGPRWG